jgi:hypothetical protein
LPTFKYDYVHLNPVRAKVLKAEQPLSALVTTMPLAWIAERLNLAVGI